MRLFSESNRQPKMLKTLAATGVDIKILHLAPAKSSGIANLCPKASEGCEAACLNWAGFQYSRKQNARIKKSVMFMRDRPAFMDQLAKEIMAARKAAKKNSHILGVRLNGTSDIKWEGVKFRSHDNIMQAFPDVCFMDYTKILNRKNLPANYRLIFSRAEDNEAECAEALRQGMNVAAVFRHVLPAAYMGMRVVDGDLHDWRYGDYDQYPNERVIIGLAAKGTKAKQDRSGFVIG